MSYLLDPRSTTGRNKGKYTVDLAKNVLDGHVFQSWVVGKPLTASEMISVFNLPSKFPEHFAENFGKERARSLGRLLGVYVGKEPRAGVTLCKVLGGAPPVVRWALMETSEYQEKASAVIQRSDARAARLIGAVEVPSKSKTCRTCRHFYKSLEQCRIARPSISTGGVAVWPRVEPGSWCSEGVWLGAK